MECILFYLALYERHNLSKLPPCNYSATPLRWPNFPGEASSRIIGGNSQAEEGTRSNSQGTKRNPGSSQTGKEIAWIG